MDEEMMDAFKEASEDYEIDLDYEFDGPRFFDFTRQEFPAEVRRAELWFQSAGSYPLSPFAVKLILRQGNATANINVSSKSKEVENMGLLDGESDNGSCAEVPITDITNRGPTNYNHIINNPKAKAMSVKPCFPRSSTLMKPTASNLAKKMEPRAAGNSRCHAMPIHGNERSLNNSSIIESQAAKRQKLEGGLLHKVADAKQQTNLIHKSVKKEGFGNSTHMKPRLTIPIEPDLKTSHRAQRIKSFRPKTGTEREQETSTAPGFKARPLNKKILEAPSLPLPKKSTPRLPEFQEFHLKTSKRALQHSSAVSSSSLHYKKFDKGVHKPATDSSIDNGDRDTERPNFVDAPEQEGCESKLKFKALPLNKKIFTSKGDLGVFRNSKQAATIPMEFNFRREKKTDHDPPVELFSKLRLSSVLQPDAGSHLQLPRPNHRATKGSKENRLGFLQQELGTLHSMKEKQLSLGGKQIQYGKNKGINHLGP